MAVSSDPKSIADALRHFGAVMVAPFGHKDAAEQVKAFDGHLEGNVQFMSVGWGGELGPRPGCRPRARPATQSRLCTRAPATRAVCAWAPQAPFPAVPSPRRVAPRP